MNATLKNLKLVKELIAKKTGLEPEQIDPSSYLNEDLNLTTEDIEEICAKVETHLELDLELGVTNSVETLETVQDLLDLIEMELENQKTHSEDEEEDEEYSSNHDEEDDNYGSYDEE